MSRNKFVEYERPQIIGSNAKAKRDAARARKINNEIQRNLTEKRNQWQILPPENMTIILHRDTGVCPAGLVLSVPHEIGRFLLHRKLAAIIEREVTVDAVIEASLEEFVEATKL